MTYRSYNFFVFPQLRKQRFECQGDSMAFLGANNFDFNMLFREGISYCDEDEAKKMREQFDEKLKLMESCDNKKTGDEQVVAVPFEEQENMDRLKCVECGARASDSGFFIKNFVFSVRKLKSFWNLKKMKKVLGRTATHSNGN